MIRYHGGLIPVPEPDLSLSRQQLDFGGGFIPPPVLRKRRNGRKSKADVTAFHGDTYPPMNWMKASLNPRSCKYGNSEAQAALG